MNFDNHLEYQTKAVKAVIGLFEGSETTTANFTIYDPSAFIEQMDLAETGTKQTEIGIANSLSLIEDEITENLIKVTSNPDNNVDVFEGELKNRVYNFAIDMETGTGKTYVYLKTIYELNKEYGFSKFIILVPSVAIRAGVINSINLLEDNFNFLYKTTINCFEYSSANKSELLSYARNSGIEIMIMTAQSGDSENKVMYSTKKSHLEETYNKRIIDIIAETRPVVIIDEPQSTSSSDNRKKFVSDMHPLFTLQYSATHKAEKNVHKIYRLSAVDAYIQKLVKEVEVVSAIPKNDNNYAYVKLLGVKNTKTTISAKIEMDIRSAKTAMVERKTVTVKAHDSLFDLSGKRDIYENIRVGKIECSSVKKSIMINDKELLVGDVINKFAPDFLKRIQIRMTISEHLEKERQLNPKGIKVLSLFFIDKVANYRSWDGENTVDGKFYKMFEEEYETAIKEYANDERIVDRSVSVDKVHNGYFAEDNKNHYKNTSSGATDEDIKAYNAIMNDKVHLMSFKNPIRFIFSHSALREGWDNPNVFQICTLNESSKNNDKKRQEIGRGLRLCVDIKGERHYEREYNRLTVVANQSYEDFAREMQHQDETEGRFKYGSIERISFAVLTNVNGETMSIDMSEMFYNHCLEKGYIDIKGKTTEQLKHDLRERCIDIPTKCNEYKGEIIEYLKNVCGSLRIKPKDEDTMKYRRNSKLVELDPNFKELWDRIKDKTKYSVDYKSEDLIAHCAKVLSDELSDISGIEVEIKKSRIIQNTTGIEGVTIFEDYQYFEGRHMYLPDVITYIQNATDLTRKTVVDILVKSGRLYDFYSNPQKFMSDCVEIIKRTINKFVLKGIKYTKIEGSEFYLQEVFPDEEREGSIVSELIKSDRSVYEYNRYDSDTEKDFATELQKDKRVIVYAKLPTYKFFVPTPVGDYSPDWAIVLDDNGVNKLYFVVETKGSLNEDDRRGKENYKIAFGAKRFNEMEDSGVGYITATKKSEFLQESKKFNE